jgi:hypothetical protein
LQAQTAQLIADVMFPLPPSEKGLAKLTENHLLSLEFLNFKAGNFKPQAKGNVNSLKKFFVESHWFLVVFASARKKAQEKSRGFFAVGKGKNEDMRFQKICFIIIVAGSGTPYSPPRRRS